MLSIHHEFQLSFCLDSDSGSVKHGLFDWLFWMFFYFKKFLRSLIWAVLRSVRTFTTLFWRVISSHLRLRYIRQINMESDDECELDSTWEEEYENKTPRKKNYKMRSRNMSAAKDMQCFRHSCRNLDDDDTDDEDEPVEGRFYNLEFHHGQIKSSPDDVHIDEFHQKWRGKYLWLEECHSYIQWLFPIQERGVNWDAHVLTKKEIKLFREDEEAKRKLVESYKLLLDFYGIRLVNETTGEVDRATNWNERFKNLNRHSHNNLRITRILKCLGTLGLQHYQAPLCKFFLRETLEEDQLQRVKQSVLDYFIFAVLDKSERRELLRFAFIHFKPREQFVWGPKKFLSGEVDSKNEENEDNNTAELKQQRETDKITNEMNEIDDNNQVGSIENDINGENDQQTLDVPVETGSGENDKDEHDSDDKSQCNSDDNDVNKNQELSVKDEHDSDDNSRCNSEDNDVKKNLELSVKDEHDSEDNRQCNSEDKDVKKNQELSVNEHDSDDKSQCNSEDNNAKKNQELSDNEHDSDNSQCNSEDNNAKKNQELSVSDAKKSGEEQSENETLTKLASPLCHQ